MLTPQDFENLRNELNNKIRNRNIAIVIMGIVIVTLVVITSVLIRII